MRVVCKSGSLNENTWHCSKYGYRCAVKIGGGCTDNVAGITPITVLEAIKGMSVEDAADKIASICKSVPDKQCAESECRDCLIRYLNSPYDGAKEGAEE